MKEPMYRTNRDRKPAGTPALAAAGSLCVLLANPAAAVELGELQVESTLGQPLRASISYALGPNEQISDRCVYLRSALAAGGLPTITRATATLSGNRIVLRGNTPLREPMMNLQLSVDCPYTARLTRDYLVMLDPPGTRQEAAAAPINAVRRNVVRDVAPATRTTTPRPATRQAVEIVEPVPAVGQYRVQVGDTLSGIVSRIEDRKLTLWPAVDAIHAANPAAFRNGDVDQLIAGSVLNIPASVASGLTTVAAETTATPAAAPAVTAASDTSARAYRGVSEGRPAVRESAPEAATTAGIDTQPAAADVAGPVVEAVAEPVVETVIEPVAEPVAEAAAQPAASAAAPAASQPAATVSIPDTRIEQPEPVPVGGNGDPSPTSAWLAWLGGSGVAIVLGLLLFGRRLRERFGNAGNLDELEDTQINEAIPQRRASDRGEADPGDNLNLSETMSQASALDVGVDFDTGEGFGTDDDMDVALDYSFASSGDYTDDVEQAEVTAIGESTDILPTMDREESIEVSEDEITDENYDMSMVIDVTKQDFSPDATTRDLQAIEVKPLALDPTQTGALDLTTEFDYKVLEQDYEEELTATQALNKEIAQAARELQDRLGEFDDDQSKISMAEDLEGTAEVTAEMPHSGAAGNETLTDLDDTDISEGMTAKLPESDDATVEMPPRGDETVEMNPDLGASVERRKKTG